MLQILKNSARGALYKAPEIFGSSVFESIWQKIVAGRSLGLLGQPRRAGGRRLHTFRA